MSRMFVAVVPPVEAVEDLDDFLSVRRSAGDLRWTPPDAFHLTLAFAEHVPDHAFEPLCEALAAVATRSAAFDSRIVGGGAFPDPDRARVLFAGLEGSFDQLSRSARNAMNSAGIATDGKRFRAHVTLARLGRPAIVTRWLRVLDSYRGPSWRVDELVLVQSHLGEGPRRRPRHEVRASFPLG